MSKYTTEVRYICETEAGLDYSKGELKVAEIIEKAAPNIFNFDFPLFDEEYRLTLECKILNQFYTREIAFETVGLWKQKLCARLNEIMPYYNELYAWKAKLKGYENPFIDTDLTTNRDIENVGNTQTENTENDTNWVLDNDTPQGTLSGVEDLTYLSSAEKVTLDGNKTGNTDSTNTEDFDEHKYGMSGRRSILELLKLYKDLLFDVDIMILKDLEVLFFGLWE